MKNSNTQTPGYHSSKRSSRENGSSKPRRIHSEGKKSKKSHGRSHQRSKPDSRSGSSSILPPPPVPPKRMDRVERDNKISPTKSSTSTYSTSTYSTSTYSSSTSTYSSCSSNSCSSGSESCSTCSFNDETNDEPQKEDEKNSGKKLSPIQKDEKLSSTKAEKHPQLVKTTDQPQVSIQKKEAADSNLPSTSSGPCSLTARLRTVFLRHVNIPLNRTDPSLKDPRKPNKEEKEEIMDLDLPKFALKMKLPKCENSEVKQRFPKALDLKPKELTTSEDSQKRELDSESRRNSLEENNIKNEIGKLSSTLRSLRKTSALFKEVNDKIDARKTIIKMEKKPQDGQQEVNIQKMEQEMKHFLDMFSVTSCQSSVSSVDFLHQHLDSEASTSHNLESTGDKINDQQNRLPHLHNLSREDSVSTSVDFHERRNTLPSKSVTETSNVCTTQKQLQQKSCLAPIIRQRASSSNSITQTEECSSPFVKQNENIPDFDIQSARLGNPQQKCGETTSIPKIEKDEIDNISPQPLKKSSMILKKPSAAPPVSIQNLQQQNKPLTTTPKSKTEPKKSITMPTLTAPTTLINTCEKKLKDKMLEKKDQQKDLKMKQHYLSKMPSTSSAILIPKKISSSKDEKCKDVEEMRKPKAFSVGSKDQLKSISKKKETSEIDSVSDGKHLRRKKSLHQMRKHGCSDSEGRSDIDTSAVLWDIDLEEQKRMLEAIKSGTNFGMSMYDRVKRRSQRPDEERKKSQALEQLREKKTKKKKELNRVCLSSSSDSDESKKDYNKQSPPVIQDIQHIKKEIEGNQNHSEVDENEEQDSFETKITKQQDSNKEECRKPEIVSSPIKRPQIAPKKPAIMERIEKEGWGDGAFESKYSSSSDEWSVSVSADEKTDNEEPGRIGDKIVQKLQAEFIKHRSNSPHSVDGHKDDLDQKLASLIETTKECHQQLDAKRLGSSSSTSSLSSSSSSSDTSDDDVRVPPKGIPIFKKHVPKKTAKISMVDVFGEDSDNQEELEKEKSTVKQQQLDHHSKAEKVQKNNNEEPENKKKSTALANIKQHPVGLKKESIKLNKNEAISAQKKVIERKRKPSERESLISTKKKLDKKEIKEALNENQASKLQNHPSKLHEQINDSKEKSSESQMVVIAAGFIEIDSKVLKGQQGDKTSLSDQNSQQMDNTQICDKQISTQENQKSSDKIQPLDQQLQKNTSDIGNLLKENADQEELDAIASINNPARLNDDDKLPKNDFIFVEKSSNERKRKSSETETFSISTKKKCDKKEEIQKTANENREPKLENPLNKVSVSDSKLASFTPHSVSERILESKEKPSESQMVVIATGFVEIDANVLKGQQETEKNSLYCHSDSSQHSKAQSTLSHNASDNERVNDSKEKEQKSDIIQTLEQQLLISNTQQHENSADQEELDAIASINNPPVRLNDECDKLLKNDSIVIEKRFIERKRKPSEDESFSTSTQNKFNKNEGIQKTHESQEPQVQKSSDKVCDLQSETKLAQSFLSHNAPERVNDSKEKPSESQMVVIATGFVEIDAELLKEQQENETASMQHHSNKGPDQMVTTQVCVEKHFSSQQNQNTLEKAFETVQTLDQQHQFHFVDSKNTFYGDFYGDSSAKQETLGAIASIKHPARLNNECANIEKEMNVAAESFSKSTQNFIKQENAQITQHQNQETMRYSQNVYEMNKEKQVPDSDMVNATNVPINTPSKWNSLFNTPTSSSHSALNDQQQRDAVIGLLGGHSNFGIAQSSNTLDELCLQQVADQQQPKQQYTPTSITISNTIQQVPNFSAMMTAASNPLSSASLSKWNPLFKTPSSSTVSGQNDQQQMNAVIGLLGGHSRFGMANASVASNTLDELCRQQFITSQQQQPQQQYIPLSNPVQSFEIKQQQQDETQKLRHHTISLPTQPIHNTHFPLNVSTSQNLQFNKLTIQKPSTINQPLHQQSTAQRTAIFQQSPSDHPTQLSQNQQKHVQGQQSIPNISAMMTAASNTLSTAALSNTLNTAALSKWNPLFKTPSSSTVSGQNDQQQINAVIGLLGGHSRFGLANASVASNTLDELCRQQFITGQQQPQQQYAPVQSFEIKQQQDKTQQQRHLISLASEPIHNAQFPMTVSSAQNQQVNQAIQKPILNYQKPQIQQQQQINIPSHRTPVVQQLPAVHPPQISQTHQQKIVQRQQSTQGGYPIIWQGQLAMKNADTLVQMHKVCGNEQLIERMNRELVTLNEQSIPLLRVTQRMRLEQSQLDSLMRKMEREENHVALICLPCGRDRNDVSIQTEKMATSFIEYYSSKSAAGIVSSHHPQGCVAHIFPPSELSRALLSKNAPEILKKVDFLGAGYLFVILTNS